MHDSGICMHQRNREQAVRPVTTTILRFGRRSAQVTCVQSRAGTEVVVPYNKGGSFGEWYGNEDVVINWEDDGREINWARHRALQVQPTRTVKNQAYYFREGITWSTL